MVFDARRNDAYREALKRVITPDTVVLDLGAGMGLLGMMAAKLGARKVYLVEPSDIAFLARKIVADNGLEDKVSVIPQKIEEAQLDEKVDVITSVMTGNFLLQEDLLGSLFNARDRFLTAGGAMLPDRASMCVAPITAPRLFAKQVECWSSQSQGLDFSAVRQHAANGIRFHRKPLASEEVIFLGEGQTLKTLDFASAQEASCNDTVDLPVSTDGICHGFAGWFDMRLGEQWLSTSPKVKPLMHWSSAFMPLDPAPEVQKGQTINLRIVRRVDDDWSWIAKGDDWSQMHSTVIGRTYSTNQFA